MTRSISSHPRSRRLRILLGSGMALFLLGSLEGVLWLACAVGGPDWRIDALPQHPPKKVICPQKPLERLCPDDDDQGERVRPEVFALAPGKPRVIVMGESFVFGLGLPMHQAWPARLGHYLDSGVEVLNFGRCGTHAGLLHAVLPETLTLKPSVVVLAIGNNEHTMTTFFVGRAGRDPLRTYELLETLGAFQLPGLISRALGQSFHVQERWDVERQVFKDPVDQRIYAARRRPPDISWFTGRLAGREVTLALESEKRLKERILAEHLRQMVRAIRSAGARAVLGTLPVQLKHPPILSGCHAEEEKTCQKIQNVLRHLDEEDPPDRMAVIRRGLQIDDRVSRFHFELGVAQLKAGMPDKATASFRLSNQWDLVPDNTPPINNLIRRLARDEGVALVDLDRLSDRYLEDSEDAFIDRVHMTAGGCDEVGAMVAKTVKGLLP